MAAKKKQTLQDVQRSKSERIMEGVAYWAAFYRKNPQRFVAEYLKHQIKTFSKNSHLYDDGINEFHVHRQ